MTMEKVAYTQSWWQWLDGCHDTCMWCRIIRVMKRC